MSDEKTKVRCRLVTRGTVKANTQALDDLAVPDPDPATGKCIMEKAIEKDTKDDDKTESS